MATGQQGAKTLQEVFNSFSHFGGRRGSIPKDKEGNAVAGPQAAAAKPDMDLTRFLKLCKDCHLLDHGFKQVDAELLFVKTAPKGAKKIYFAQFKELVAGVAKLKEVKPEVIISQIRSAEGPVPSTLSQHPELSKDGSMGSLKRGSAGSAGSMKKDGQLPRRCSSGSSVTTPSWKRSPPAASSMCSSSGTPESLPLDSAQPHSSNAAKFQLVDNEAPAHMIPKQGFTIVEGMDVSSGRILTDELRNTIQQPESAEAPSAHVDDAYRRLWRKKRAEQGLTTKSNFAKPHSDLRAEVGNLSLSETDDSC